LIGNDVVDLALAQNESHWQRKGFLAKLFTPSEQLLILNSEAPEIAVWNLWSRKEAAYKIYNRQTQVRAFIPLQLECFDTESRDGFHYGEVLCYGIVYYTKTKITPECIETVAVLQQDDFNSIIELHASVEILKINGIPYYATATSTVKPISKSHHGRFEKLVTLSDSQSIG